MREKSEDPPLEVVKPSRIERVEVRESRCMYARNGGRKGGGFKQRMCFSQVDMVHILNGQGFFLNVDVNP